MVKKILIIGGTGLLGRAVKEKLLSKGYDVKILTRDIKLEKQEGFYHYNMEKNFLGYRAIDQIDIVINLAGANVIEKTWTSKRKKVLRESRVGINQFLYSVFKGEGPKPELFISASAIGIYGDRGEDLIDENSDPGQDSFIVRLCKEWEQSADKFKEYGTRVIKARISNVIAGTDGFFPKIMESARIGVLPVLGKGKQYISWIHIDDLAALMYHCVLDQSIVGPVNFCTQDAVQYEELIQSIKKIKGKNWLSPKIPRLVLKTIIGERAHLLFDSLRCEPAKAIDSGFSFEYPQISSVIHRLLRS